MSEVKRSAYEYILLVEYLLSIEESVRTEEEDYRSLLDDMTAVKLRGIKDASDACIAHLEESKLLSGGSEYVRFTLEEQLERIKYLEQKVSRKLGI